MRRKDLIKRLEANGWTLYRHGGNHDIYKKGKERECVPCHQEIDEMLAKTIIRRRGL